MLMDLSKTFSALNKEILLYKLEYHGMFGVTHDWFNHDDVIKWKQIPRYWPFVRGIPTQIKVSDAELQ